MNMHESTIVADGIYLVVQTGDEDGVLVPVLDVGRSELIRRDPLMPLEVASAEARLGPGNEPAIDLALSSDLAPMFAEITRRYEGSRLALVVGGAVILAPYINEAIADGQLRITVGGGFLDALRKAKCLRVAGTSDAIGG